MENEANESVESCQSNNRPESPRIVIVGSINMDLVIRAAAIPGPGQTIAGHNFSTMPGGKGANQAVAAARCGGQVNIIGRVGNDDFGQRLTLGLKANGVDTTSVMVCEGVSTGVATIIVNDIGENAICVAGGANLMVSVEDVEEQAEVIERADLILLQLEIPQQTVIHVIGMAHEHNIPVILNPAPVGQEIHPGIYESDVLIPNQDETTRLCGEPASDMHSAKLAGSALAARGARVVVVTMGRRGAIAITQEHIFQVQPFSANIVDTTGAGDAFCGAFSVACAKELKARGLDMKMGIPVDILKNATRFAAAAGALACKKFGAQPSMPHLKTIERLLQRSC
ncbi:MAG: ribokinase [Planctomycetes bacterium]|nr:ribokinase [Planctomycetota bacterium]